MTYQIVGANIETWLISGKGTLPDELAEDLDVLKQVSEEAEEDLNTDLALSGERRSSSCRGQVSNDAEKLRAWAQVVAW
jgi:hypothetical protein